MDEKTKGQWQIRSRTEPSGKVVRFREREIGGGAVEREYLDDGDVRSSQAQPVSLRGAAV